MYRSRSPSRSSFQRDTDAYRSKPAVHTHHVHDLEAALAASIGRSFDVLSRQFREAHSERRTTTHQ